MIDFKGRFYDARCLLEHRDPYKDGEPLRVYQAEAKGSPLPSEVLRQVLSLELYLPNSYLFIFPFAMLPWEPAHLLWMIATAGALVLASFLIWSTGSRAAPAISIGLICFLLLNCEAVFATGNPAGIAVGLCVVAVWCFLEGRFLPAGILCLAVSLAIKPHDVGMIWLFFVLAGGVYRKHALQTLIVTVVLGLPVFLWTSHIAPHWIQELHSHVLANSAPGGAGGPGANSANSGSGPSMVIDLQSAIYVFRSDPRIYNPVSYLLCGPLFLIWLVTTLRFGFSRQKAWLALAAIVPLSAVATYHRPYDAKLLLLAIPACAMLWAEGGLIGRIALLMTTAGIVSTADIPLTILMVLTKNLHISTARLSGQILTVLLLRPVPVILLATSIFYLYAYMRSGEHHGSALKHG
jgi:hypothetical protein